MHPSTKRVATRGSARRAKGRGAALQAPAASLQLEHVHGYDGRGALAANVFYTEHPYEIVYYAAGAQRPRRAAALPPRLASSRLLPPMLRCAAAQIALSSRSALEQ